MVTAMQGYFAKVKAAITTGGGASFRYKTGTVPANGSVVFDAPTDLGFTAATHNVYSIGVQLAMVDPLVGSNPPVVDAETVLRWEIAADGKITIRNNYSGVVTYHARITMPVKKP
jgi:hypothetical protein